MSIVKGNLIEKEALTYLCQQGLRLIKANYRSRCGEIDLIMKDKKVIVFVEVRARGSKTYGSALESITYSKQSKIIKTAQYYLSTNRLMDKVCARFDVIVAQGSEFKLEWIKNAFSEDF